MVRDGAFSAACTDKQPGEACDEYPFWSSEQGGPNNSVLPSLQPIDAVQNTDQGTSYRVFVQNCAMRSKGDERGGQQLTQGDAFISLPIDPELRIPTIATLCNGKAE